MTDSEKPPAPRYRFGFVLTVAAGNMTRYLNLRKYAERVEDVECVWAPVKHFLEPDPFQKLPGPLRNRAVVMRESEPVMHRYGQMDAIMFHAFEPYVRSVSTHRLGRKPAIVWSQDNPPYVPGGEGKVAYGGTHARSDARRRLRYRFDLWCASRVDLFSAVFALGGRYSRPGLRHTSGPGPSASCGIGPGTMAVCPARIVGGRKTQSSFRGWRLRAKRWRYASHRLAGAVSPEREPSSGHEIAPSGTSGAGCLRVYRYVGERRKAAAALRRERYFRAAYPRGCFILGGARRGGYGASGHQHADGRHPRPDSRQRNGLSHRRRRRSRARARIERLVEDAALRDRMGKAGRALVEKDFSAAVCVPRILDAMKRTVDGLSGSHPRLTESAATGK